MKIINSTDDADCTFIQTYISTTTMMLNKNLSRLIHLNFSFIFLD